MPYNDPDAGLQTLGGTVRGIFEAVMVASVNPRHTAENFSEAEITLAEALWRADINFEQQKSLGPYYADFWFEEVGLVVEVDGKSYHQDAAKDERRTQHLVDRFGVAEVVRFSAKEVFRAAHEVAAKINEKITEMKS